jgi:hypothetical protein
LHWKQPRCGGRSPGSGWYLSEPRRGYGRRLHYGRRLQIGSRKIPPLFAGSAGCGNGKDGSLKTGRFSCL